MQFNNFSTFKRINHFLPHYGYFIATFITFKTMFSFLQSSNKKVIQQFQNYKTNTNNICLIIILRICLNK